jgi:hypothetical protein
LQNNWCVNAVELLTLEPTLALSDLHASAEYRSHLAAVLCRRAVAAMTQKSETTPSRSPLALLKTWQENLLRLFRR